MMEDNNDNILAQIQALRAEAGKNLQGNEYFTVAHKLDALVADGDPDSVDAQAALQTIRSRLFSCAPGSAETAIADDAEKAVLEDIQAFRAEAAEKLHGNEYFTLAQKLDALVAGGGLSGPEAREQLQVIRDSLAFASSEPGDHAQNEFLEHIVALRVKASETLQGNDYFSVAYRLDALLVSEDLSTTSASEALEQIRALIETGQPDTATPAQSPNNAEQSSEAVTTIVFPKANSFSAPQPTVAVRLAANEGEEPDAAGTQAEPEAVQEEASADAAPESHEAPAYNSQQSVETGEKSGFDALTEASWRRVREVAGSDEIPAQAMNGAAADGMAVAQPEPAGNAEAAMPQAEQADIASDAEIAETITDEIAKAPASREETAPMEVAEPASEAQTEAAPVTALHQIEQAITASDAEIAKTVTDEFTEAPAPEEKMIPAETVEPIPEAQTETTPSPETLTAQNQGSFKVTPRPVIINRPVKKERFARLKRLAKLAHLPIRKD